MVIDKAVFPRDKVCAGWITPQVVDDLELDLDEYAQRTHAAADSRISRRRDRTVTRCDDDATTTP